MRTTIVSVYLSMFLLGVVLCPLYPASTTASISFDLDKLQFTELQGYDHITMGGCDLTDQAGHPQLPTFLYHLSLPPGAIIRDAAILGTVDEVLPGEYTPFPAQPPAILSMPGVSVPVPQFVEPLDQIYHSSDPYPRKIVKAVSSGNLGSSSIGAVIIHPLTYLPGNRNLVFHRRVEFEIVYDIEAPRQLGRLQGSHSGPELMDDMYTSLTGVSQSRFTSSKST